MAYRYFATRKRKFIIADAPGHEQYTRNMVTAAAGSDAAVVLVDITKLDTHAQPVELLAQTRRHALLAQLLRVPSIVFAINKLDAVDDPAQAYEAVRAALLRFAGQARMAVAGVVPVSALRGDNVTRAAGRRLVRRPFAAAAAGTPADRAGAQGGRPADPCPVRGARRRQAAAATSRARCGAASPMAA